MFRKFDHVETIIEARASNRGHKLFKEIICVAFIALMVIGVLGMFEIIPILVLFDIDFQDPTVIYEHQYATVASLYMKIISIIAIVLFCRFAQKRSFSSIGLQTKNALLEYFKGLLIGLILFSIIVAIIYLSDGYYFVGMKKPIDWTFILTIFMGFVIQGAQEEILCRGFMMTSIARKNSVWAAIIINSVAFGLLHLGNDGVNILGIVNIILVGVFLSVYMLRTNNILGACAIHSMWNFTQGSIYGLRISGLNPFPTVLELKPIGHDLLTGGDFGPEASLVTTLVFVIAIAVLVFKKPEKRIGKENETDGTQPAV